VNKPVRETGRPQPAANGAPDLLPSERQPLDAIFAPHSVAVIGATERQGTVGRALIENLLRSPFGGTVYPVNQQRGNVLGVRAYRAISDIPEVVDLAVIVTPAETVPAIITQCADAGVGGAIVISAGFKEQGKEGQELERQILERMKGGSLRLVGPNCLGVMNPLTGLNATFAGTIARPGNVAFLSQAGRYARRCWTGARRKWSASARSCPSARCSM
jgi:acetyltransferase